jgi:hypothetical protein
MNNGYMTVFLNLSDLTNFNNVHRKLKPDFKYLDLYFFAIFRNKKLIDLLSKFNKKNQNKTNIVKLWAK